MAIETPKASKWGRWQWPEKIGRWHAIAASTDGVYSLACGRTRQAPKITAGRPDNAQCCPTCATLDNLRIAFRERGHTEPVSPVTITPAPVRELVPMASGRCTCGCDQSDEARALREQVAAAEETTKAQRAAEFDAYLKERAL